MLEIIFVWIEKWSKINAVLLWNNNATVLIPDSMRLKWFVGTRGLRAALIIESLLAIYV